MCNMHFCFSQSDQAKTYQNYFGKKIILHEDSTFEFSFGFSIYHYCSKGKWSIINDTIFFTPIVLYDTLMYIRKGGMYDFELAKSKFCYSRTMDRADYYNGTKPVGGQSDYFLPQKLLFKKDKLYDLNHKNKPIKTKRKNLALGITKKMPMYYFK